MSSKSILHINIDSFAAVVEQIRRADLRGKAVIVGRARGSSVGIVVSASPEARKLGVVDGMGVRQAQRACADGVILNEDRASYAQVFNRILDILACYSPLLEPDALGSAYLDVTGSRIIFGDADHIAGRILSEVREQVGLQASIGCASIKLLAKAASGTRRSGIVKVCPGFEGKFLSPLPVSVLDSVSNKIAKRLGELGVSTVGELAGIPEALLVRQFGPVGSLIRRESLGIDPRQVRAAYPPEVIITEHMFDSPAQEPSEVWEHLRLLANDAAANLRKRGSLAGEVMLELSDEAVESGDYRLSALHHFKKPTDSIASISQALERMLISKMRPGMEVGRVRVTFSELTNGTSAQLCLIGDGERRQRLSRAVELLRERFGDRSVCMASALGRGVG